MPPSSLNLNSSEHTHLSTISGEGKIQLPCAAGLHLFYNRLTEEDTGPPGLWDLIPGQSPTRAMLSHLHVSYKLPCSSPISAWIE